MQRTFDVSQVSPSGLTQPIWWEEISSRGYRHITAFAWQSEKKPNLSADFPGIEIIASHNTKWTMDYLAVIDDCLVEVFWNRDELNVTVAGKSEDFSVLQEKFAVLYPVHQDEDETRVSLKFWFNAPNGMGAAYARLLAVPEWKEIEDNYGQVIKDEFSRLTGSFRPSHGGQLLLWQGPPGTGKTFAIRALVREWVDWCDGAYIVDPDAFFHNANYMMQVMLDEGGQNYRRKKKLALTVPGSPGVDDDEYDDGAPEDDEDDVRWKLVILEDSGELLASDAKQRTGQALSRLLNIADGLIGQGLKVLILITTNEEMDSLHDAVSRPGRCASKIVFPRLTKDEANVWMKKHDLPEVDGDRSLAELYGESEHFTKKAEGKQPYQRELGFNVPKKQERRAIGFDTGRYSPAAAPVGPAVERDDDFIPIESE